MKINGFVAYVKQLWKNKPDTSTPVSAERLLHIEDGIKASSDAIEKIEAAVISQIINDPDKIASMAALYEVNQKVTEQGKQITQLNSDFGKTLKIVESGFSVFSNVPAKGSATNDVTFTGRYDINPFIIVSPASVGCKLIPAASYRRNTGFKLEVSNPFDTANYGEIRWFAVM